MVRYTSAEDAVKVIKSNDRVYIHGVSASPFRLINAMVARAGELKNVELIHVHTEGEAVYTEPKYKNSFHINSLFVGENVRKAVNTGRGDYIPIFLSEVPALFRKNILPLDVALIHVSPPDKHGYCSLGVSVETAVSAVQTAKLVIAQVNPNMPRSHGDGLIHASKIDAMVEVNDALPEQIVPEPDAVERKIGQFCAGLIEDGSTLQMALFYFRKTTKNAQIETIT